MIVKIYLASSWKNEGLVLNTAQLLRKEGYEVDAFCDASCNRHVFSFSALPTPMEELTNLTIRGMSKVKKAFEEDKKWLDWCDTCIMVLPCGKSAHLEAGYVKGCGKKLVMFAPGRFVAGDVDVMYSFADYLTESYVNLINYLEGINV